MPYPEMLPAGDTFCTDENIAVQAPGDFPVLCPSFQAMAYGTDGVIASGSLWTLTSASVGFSAAGVQPQMVVLLTKPTSFYRGAGVLMAVDTVSTNSIMLRRLGQQSAIGQPPSPAAGLTGVEFTISTLGPQIEEVSFDLCRTYSIDPTVPGRTPQDMYDMRDLRQACVLKVLVGRYADAIRESKGDFVEKLQYYRRELQEVQGRLSIRWAQDNTGIQQTTTRFSTRLVR